VSQDEEPLVSLPRITHQRKFLALLKLGNKRTEFRRLKPLRSPDQMYLSHLGIQRHRQPDTEHQVAVLQLNRKNEGWGSPTAATIDSQSVKSAEKGGPMIRRGTTLAKRSKARSATSSLIRKGF